jgi:hypothetical protein
MSEKQQMKDFIMEDFKTKKILDMVLIEYGDSGEVLNSIPENTKVELYTGEEGVQRYKNRSNVECKTTSMFTEEVKKKRKKSKVDALVCFDSPDLYIFQRTLLFWGALIRNRGTLYVSCPAFLKEHLAIVESYTNVIGKENFNVVVGLDDDNTGFFKVEFKI